MAAPPLVPRDSSAPRNVFARLESIEHERSRIEVSFEAVEREDSLLRRRAEQLEERCNALALEQMEFEAIRSELEEQRELLEQERCALVEARDRADAEFTDLYSDLDDGQQNAVAADEHRGTAAVDDDTRGVVSEVISDVVPEGASAEVSDSISSVTAEAVSGDMTEKVDISAGHTVRLLLPTEEQGPAAAAPNLEPATSTPQWPWIAGIGAGMLVLLVGVIVSLWPDAEPLEPEIAKASTADHVEAARAIDEFVEVAMAAARETSPFFERPQQTKRRVKRKKRKNRHHRNAKKATSKTASKKSASKKASSKKASSKKASSKKALSKKASSKKTSRKKTSST